MENLKTQGLRDRSYTSNRSVVKEEIVAALEKKEKEDNLDGDSETSGGLNNPFWTIFTNDPRRIALLWSSIAEN